MSTAGIVEAVRGPQPPLWLVAAMVGLPPLGVVATAILAVHWGSVLPASLWLFATFYLASAIGAEVGFHRYFSHRAFKCGPTVRLVLGIFGSIAGQGPVLYWAAIHREHHRFADTEQDPHAPLPRGLSGFLRAHVGWLFASRPPDIGRALPDLLRDRVTLFVQRHYMLWFVGGLLLPAAIGGLLAGARGALEGFLWGGLVRVFVNHHVTWSVNSVCHLAGARPNATRDRSGNVWLLALPTLGGAWHNNHHAYPASATNDFHWWQLDPGAWLIRGGAACGLVWDVREHRAMRRAADT